MEILFITNIANKVGNFSKAGIAAAHSLEHGFHIAARWNCSEEQRQKEREKYGIGIHHIELSRSPFSLSNIKAYRQLVNIIKSAQIDCIHCNTPVGGILGRLAGRKCGIKKVIYQVHGFHFYKGAPLKNWLLYYPVEKWLARYTDALITINREDHELAKSRMMLRNGGKVYYVPGVGVDLEKFSRSTVEKRAKRRELGIPENAVVMLSVGELNSNKNHAAAIRAAAALDVYYIIAGQGGLHQELQRLIGELGIGDRVKLLGYRSDVKELYEASDIFVFPSFREGLSVSVMEAMASGLPCIVSRIRGNTDLVENGSGGFLCEPKDPRDFAEKISILAADARLRMEMGQYNLSAVQRFGSESVIGEIRNIYKKEFDRRS